MVGLANDASADRTLAPALIRRSTCQVTERPDLAQTRQQLHFNEVAYRWHHFGPPLRPCADDVRVMEELVRRGSTEHHAGARRLRALLWGVTPEIAEMAWPDETELLAVDKSEPMIRQVWPGDIAGRRKAVCADWFEFARPVHRYDVIIGDGNFPMLAYPQQHRALAAIARDSLASSGTLVARFFILPSEPESPDVVFDDLLANRIRSFHSFKFRLAMALQEDASTGVRMSDVYDAWNTARIDVGALMGATGWSQATIETMAIYKGRDSRLSFPSAAQLDALMREYFDKLDERYLSYEMGERCPIVSFRPRG